MHLLNKIEDIFSKNYGHFLSKIVDLFNKLMDLLFRKGGSSAPREPPSYGPVKSAILWILNLYTFARLEPDVPA